MKFPKQHLKGRYPSPALCTFVMAIFSFYCYRNIFLQSEIGYKLPTVDLVQALNNYEAFVNVPSTERFDMYVNLAKTFEAYKDDYMVHYEEYSLLVNNYLILSESQIAIKYYAFKNYRNEGYKTNDTFVLGSPIIEFNKNFNNPVELSTVREHNLIHKHSTSFDVSDHREVCETFFNNYIYPMYKSQSESQEVEVARAMSSILNHRTIIKRLQITIFFGSLILLAIIIISSVTASMKPTLLIENEICKYVLLISYVLVYVAVFIVSFICLSITFVTYHIDINFNGLHNTSYNVIQLLILGVIGYISYYWVINFVKKHADIIFAAGENENEPVEQIDEVKEQVMDFRKRVGLALQNNESGIDLETGTGSASGGVTTNINMIIAPPTTNNNIKNLLNSAVKPFVDSVKHMVTPAVKASAVPSEFQGYIGENGPTFEDIQRIIQYTNNPSNINTGFTTIINEANKLDAIGEEHEIELDPKKNSLEAFPALNLVSAISVNNPDCSAFGKTGGISSVASNSNSGSPNEFKFDLNSTGDSLTKSLVEKRNSFYQHARYSLKNDYASFNSSAKASANLSEISNGSGKYYKKSPLNKLSATGEHLHYDLNNVNSLDLNSVSSGSHNLVPNTVSGLSIAWEKKFGLSSSKSDASTIQRGNSIKDRVSHFSASSSKKGQITANIQELKRNDTLKTKLSSAVTASEKESIHQSTKSVKRDQISSQQTQSKTKSKPQSQSQSALSIPKEKEMDSKLKYEFFLPSAGVRSESTESSSLEDKDASAASHDDNQESVFSFDRIVHEQNKK